MTAPQATKKPRVRKIVIREGIPLPGTPEGEIFSYTPDEAAQWLPFGARKLLEMAYRHEIEHVDGGNRIWFSGLNIRAITLQFTVRPISETKPRRAAA